MAEKNSCVRNWKGLFTGGAGMYSKKSALLLWLKNEKVTEDTKSVSCQVNTTKKLYEKKVSKNLCSYRI